MPDVIAEVGGLVDESGVCLAVYGPDLNPDHISSVLGCLPTHAHRRGDTRRSGSRPFQRGAWLLEERGFAPIGPEELARRLLGRLPGEPAIWDRLAAEYDVQLRIAVHFTGWNKGFVLSPDLIATLRVMRVSIGFDLYAYGDDDDESDR